jgi:hypothetical protein
VKELRPTLKDTNATIRELQKQIKKQIKQEKEKEMGERKRWRSRGWLKEPEECKCQKKKKAEMKKTQKKIEIYCVPYSFVV